MALGITEEYEIKKIVKKKLIINDKVINYLFKVLTDESGPHYVIMNGYGKYTEITKDIIKQLLSSERNLSAEVIAEIDEYPEYEGVPFVVSHASPYDHRWEGDYDEDAYDDWKVVTHTIEDIFYDDTWDKEPYYAKHPDEFDWEDEVVEEKDPKLEYTYYSVR